jgi:hypothetical protein
MPTTQRRRVVGPAGLPPLGQDVEAEQQTDQAFGMITITETGDHDRAKQVITMLRNR